MARIKEDVGEFIPSKPGEPFTWLKAKYRTPKPVGKGHADQNGHAGKKKIHRPLTPAERALHAAQPYKVMVMRNGKCRMEVHEEMRPKSQ